MKAFLKMFLLFLISLGEAKAKLIPTEEWTYESDAEAITINDPEAMAKLKLADEVRDSDGTKRTGSIIKYVGKDCCKLSTTPKCLKKKGSCLPINETCYGDEYLGQKFCVISNLKSCKCCVPTDCEKKTLDPCKALSGTCIGANQECDGNSVCGKDFCKNDKTCKCCFPDSQNCPVQTTTTPTTLTTPTTQTTPTTVASTTTPFSCGPQDEHNCNQTKTEDIGYNSNSSSTSHVFTSGMNLGLRYLPDPGQHDLRIRVDAPGYESGVFAIRLDEHPCTQFGCWLYQYWTPNMSIGSWTGIWIKCVPKGEWLLLTITDHNNGNVYANLHGFVNLPIPVSLPEEGVTIRVEVVPSNLPAEISFDCPLP